MYNFFRLNLKLLELTSIYLMFSHGTKVIFFIINSVMELIFIFTMFNIIDCLFIIITEIWFFLYK